MTNRSQKSKKRRNTENILIKKYRSHSPRRISRVIGGETHHYTTEDLNDVSERKCPVDPENIKKNCIEVAGFETNSSRFLQIPPKEKFCIS